MKNKVVLGPIKQLLPLRGLPLQGPIHDEALKTVDDCALILDGDRIDAIKPFASIPRADVTHHLEEDFVCLPGLIDAHTHLCYLGERSLEFQMKLAGANYLEIAKSGGGIASTMREIERGARQDLHEALVRRLQEVLSEGVTTCEIKSGYGDELKMLEAIELAKQDAKQTIIPTCLAAHIPKKGVDEKKCLEEIVQDLLPEVKKRNLAARVDIFIDTCAFSPDAAKNYLLEAKKLGFDITVHADQFTRGGSRIAADVSALSADHLEASEEEDLLYLKEKGVAATVLPGATLGLGWPFPKARRMLDLGLSLVIASDKNPGSAPMGNLLLQASLLAMNQKLTMAETLSAITFRAAAALNLRDRGSIAPGLKADLVFFAAKKYQEILYSQGSLRPSLIVAKGSIHEHPAGNHTSHRRV